MQPGPGTPPPYGPPPYGPYAYGPPYVGPLPPVPPSARTPTAVILLSVGAALAGTWIVAATFVTQAGAWLFTEATMELGGTPSGLPWLVAALGNAAIVAIPAGVIWLLARVYAPTATGVVAAGRAWTLAGVAGGLLGTLRIIPMPLNDWLLLGTALLAVVLAVAVRMLRRPSLRKPDGGRLRVGRGAGAPHPRVAGFGLAAGLVALLPWLWAGALGGVAETLLAVAAAAAFGWLVAGVLDGGFFAAYARSRPWCVIVGGLSAGTALAPLAAGVGGFGVSLASLLTVPALGFAAAAIAGSALPAAPPVPPPAARAGAAPVAGPAAPGAPAVEAVEAIEAVEGGARWGSLTVTLLAGVAALGPLAFVDPEETSLILGLNDVGRWALTAVALGAVGGLVVGAVLGLALSARRSLGWWPPAAAALVLLVAAGAVYGLAGRPGLYGDRLFVVMGTQAPLDGLDAMPDRAARLRATYDRLVRHADATQADLRGWLDRYGISYTPYYLVNGLMVDAGPELRELLSVRDDVDRVLIDPRLRPLPVGPPTERGPIASLSDTPQWNIAMVGAPEVWREVGARGSGITVGTSDSGVDGSHPALRAGFRGGDDSWYDPWNGTPTPTDHGGHGTHTLGSALGRDGIGVAPDAQWIGCVNLDRNLGSPSLYLDCLQFMLAPFPPGGDPLRDGQPARAAHVLTNSWGCPVIEGCDLDSLRPAVDAIRAAGIFMVVAAGNSGPVCGSVDDPPAPYDSAFTVGAVDRDGDVAPFSSRGPTPDGLVKPDVVAPGVDVVSALPDGTYGSLDGTSMATPHVAGVVALLWSAQPSLIGDIEATEELLRSTATEAMPTPSDNPSDGCQVRNVTGAGIVDALAAVERARSAS
jgi:subtilisin family serine protease